MDMENFMYIIAIIQYDTPYLNIFIDYVGHFLCIGELTYHELKCILIILCEVCD